MYFIVHIINFIILDHLVNVGATFHACTATSLGAPNCFHSVHCTCLVFTDINMTSGLNVD